MLLKATIDPLTRVVTLDSYSALAMKKDFRVSGIKFTCPNQVGIDIPFSLSSSAVRIMYKTPAFTTYYTVVDLVVDNTNAVFTWIFDDNVTKVEGNCYFSVCAAITNSQHVVTKEWHSAIAQFRIGNTIHTQTLVPTQEQIDEIAYLTALIEGFLPANEGSESQVLMKIGEGTRWENPVVVTNNQTATNGTKIAEVQSGTATYSLYAPAVVATPSESSGTNLGTVKVGATTKTFYAAVDSDTLNAALTSVYGG